MDCYHIKSLVNENFYSSSTNKKINTAEKKSDYIISENDYVFTYCLTGSEEEIVNVFNEINKRSNDHTDIFKEENLLLKEYIKKPKIDGENSKLEIKGVVPLDNLPFEFDDIAAILVQQFSNLDLTGEVVNKDEIILKYKSEKNEIWVHYSN